MNTNRLEAFSDGVYAIAITLLVLDIRLPETTQSIGVSLAMIWPSYLAYVISFIVIGAIWINHHAMFKLIDRVDHKLLLINTLHLLFVAFLPFPTAVLAKAFRDTAQENVATIFYGATLVIIGILVTWSWHYAARSRLISDTVSVSEAKAHTRRYMIGPIGYAVGAVIALVSPWAALAIFVGLNMFFLWPRKGLVANHES